MLQKVQVFPLAILAKCNCRRKQQRKGHHHAELLETDDPLHVYCRSCTVACMSVVYCLSVVYLSVGRMLFDCRSYAVAFILSAALG